MTRSFLEEIMTSSKDVLKYFDLEMAIGIRNVSNPTQKSAADNDTVTQSAGS